MAREGSTYFFRMNKLVPNSWIFASKRKHIRGIQECENIYHFEV
jgi:hypothetical protein